MKTSNQQPVTRKDNRPCPNRPKGERCPVCGGSYVCLHSWRPKKLTGKKA
jgi:hypothetical protein